MKLCTVCGTENQSTKIRCSVCHSLLPEQKIEVPPIHTSGGKLVRICNKCGEVCDKNAVRCSKCGSFLTEARNYSDVKGTLGQEIKPITMRFQTGEELTLTHGQIIGRQYQPKLFDAYAHRAEYMVLWEDCRYVLKNQRDDSVIPVKFGQEYVIGRKKVVFTDQ